MLANKTILQYLDCSIFKEGKYLLQNISFNINQGELIAIIGKNGMGKSTLCKMITNNIKVTTGKIIENSKLKIAYVPQINNFNIIIPISTIDFITLNKKNKKLTKEDQDLLANLGIIKLLDKNFHSLSGGEKQKVILGRALLLKADVLVLDEPSSFIDSSNKNNIYNIINNLRLQQKFSVIIVSHDIDIVLNKSDWVLLLQDGKIKYQGTSSQIKQNQSFIEVFKHNELNL